MSLTNCLVLAGNLLSLEVLPLISASNDSIDATTALTCCLTLSSVAKSFPSFRLDGRGAITVTRGGLKDEPIRL